MKIVQWKKQITPPLGQLNDSNIIKQSQSEQGPSFSCWSWLVLTGKLCGRDLGNSSSITLCSPGSPVSTSISHSLQLELYYDPEILEIFLMYSKGQTPRAFMNFSTVEKCLGDTLIWGFDSETVSKFQTIVLFLSPTSLLDFQ